MKLVINHLEHKLASVTENNLELSGRMYNSFNNKYTLIYHNASFPNDGEKNIALITKDQKVVFLSVDRPMNGVVTDNGLFIIATYNIKNDEHNLCFFDANGKKIKKLKSHSTNILLTQDSEYLIVQNLCHKEKQFDRMLIVYSIETLKITMKIYNPLYNAKFETDIERKILKMSYDTADSGLPWRYAEIDYTKIY